MTLTSLFEHWLMFEHARGSAIFRQLKHSRHSEINVKRVNNMNISTNAFIYFLILLLVSECYVPRSLKKYSPTRKGLKRRWRDVVQQRFLRWGKTSISWEWWLSIKFGQFFKKCKIAITVKGTTPTVWDKHLQNG